MSDFLGGASSQIHNCRREPSGTIIVTASSGKILRLTRSGSSAQVAAAPPGSQWLAITEDTGNLIVGDNSQHAIWRISHDGSAG